MEIDLYNNLDPRRLMRSNAYKSMSDVVPLLGGMGEPITINSESKGDFDGNIDVRRDLTLQGNFNTSFVLHGGINVMLDHARVTNIDGAVATITLASDFNGTLTIVDSRVSYKGKMQAGLALWTDIDDMVSSQRAQKITIANSQVDGVSIDPSQLEFSGNNTINAASSQMISHINTSYFDASDAVLKVKYMALYNSGEGMAGEIKELDITGGPVEIDGKWDINKIVINSGMCQELIKFNGQVARTTISIKRIEINRAPHGISIFYADNTVLKFDHAFMGNPKQQYNAAINDSIVKMRHSTDRFNWILSGKNAVDLDKMSITGLRNKKQKFIAVDLDAIHKQQQAQAESKQNKQALDNPNIATSDNKQDTDNHGMPKKSDMTKNKPSANTKKMTKRGANEANKIQHADGMSKLNQLIGLKSVKHTLQGYINIAVNNKRRKDRGLQTVKGLSYHMIMAGNPGTGKTTVARIVGQILHENGVLRTDKVVETTSKDLVSKNVGETPDKTHKIVEKAMGGVLFVDEAYMLNAKGNSFGQEALDQLMKDMDDHRTDLIVVLAGYNDEMHHFVYDENPGMPSRIGKWVTFPDYTMDELIQIFELMCKNQGTLINPQYLNTKMFKFCINYYQGFLKSKKGTRIRSNGRGVRNYFQALITAQSNRLANIDDPTNEQLVTITAEDIKNVYIQVIKTMKTRHITLRDMGFGLKKKKPQQNKPVKRVKPVINNRVAVHKRVINKRPRPQIPKSAPKNSLINNIINNKRQGDPNGK